VAEIQDETTPAVPSTVRVAALLVFVEAAALALTALALLVLAFVHTTTRLWAGLTVAGFAALGAVLLALCARGLLQLRPTARSPIVVVQILALPVGYSLGFQNGRMLIAAPVLILAVAVLVLLLSKPSRDALDRVL
jgi:hypothetical protein